MSQQIANALTAHLYMMNWLKNHQATYQEAMRELENKFPGWFETDGDPMIIEWIVNHTTH